MLQHLLAWAGGASVLPIGLMLFASAAVEHVFPPFPGDVLVAFGAALAFARGWCVALLFLVALAGSSLGSVAAYYAGRWLAVPGARARSPRIDRLRAAAAAAAGVITRRGPAAVALARLVPVGRALAIVAAGYGGMPASRAIPAAVLGAALWIGVLFGAGAAVGTHFNDIARVLERYNRVALAALVAICVGWMLRAWVRRRARARMR